MRLSTFLVGLVARLRLELDKTGRFWSVYWANVVGWFRTSRLDRLPLQPWLRESQPSHTVIETIAAGADLPPPMLVAYDASGVVEHPWRWPPSIGRLTLDITRALEVTVLPRAVLLASDGHLMRRTFASVRGHHGGLKRPQIGQWYFYRDKVGGIARRLDEPVLVVETCWPRVYGHILLEVVPTLALRARAPQDIKVLTSTPLSRTVSVLFEQMGVPPEKVIGLTGPTWCREAYLVDQPVLLTGQIHPVARDAYERLKALGRRSNIVPQERIFISRAGNPTRRLDVEAEVEALFARYGFAIVSPERLPIEDQIALFAGARMIAGLGGSAMHNAVFAAADCPVLIIQPRHLTTRIDTGLAHEERRLGYVFGETLPLGDRFSFPWHVDIDAVQTAIHQHFGL